MQKSFNERLKAIPWTDFDTAYGPATTVPDQLSRLAAAEERISLPASHELWCGLCHQQAYVSSAAVPALPFILEVMDQAGEQLTIEILDILLGFACCNSLENSPPRWIAELRACLAAERSRFERLSVHCNPDIADFALKILRNLESSP